MYLFGLAFAVVLLLIFFFFEVTDKIDEGQEYQVTLVEPIIFILGALASWVTVIFFIIMFLEERKTIDCESVELFKIKPPKK